MFLIFNTTFPINSKTPNLPAIIHKNDNIMINTIIPTNSENIASPLSIQITLLFSFLPSSPNLNPNNIL